MIRSFGKARFFACAVLSASALVNCSADSAKTAHEQSVDGNGSIGLALQMPNGKHADTAHYDITHPNGFHLAGDIDISQSPTISALIGGIPAGTGYSITVTTASTDGALTCLGSALFNVASSTTTPVNLILRCRGVGNVGTIIINGTLNMCPTLDVIGASPLSAKVGTAITLTSQASDLDNVPNPLSYTWTDGVSFNATTANTTYTCTAVGPHSITLTVTDGDPGCEAIGTAVVMCTAASSVDAGGGAGGTSGAGGAAGATGGTGGAGGPGGDAGAGGVGGTTGGVGGASGAAGGATGGAGGASGGAGGASGGAGGATGGAAGSTGGAGGATGGAAGATGGTSSVDAGSDGHIVTVEEILAAKSAACLACAQTNCATEIGGCVALRGQTAAAGPSVGASRETLCTDALACVLPPGAVSCGTGFLNACYCGSAANEACLMTGNPDGVCKPQLEAGLETTEPVTVAVSFTTTSLGAGAAMFLAQCLDGTCDTCFQP